MRAGNHNAIAVSFVVAATMIAPQLSLASAIQCEAKGKYLVEKPSETLKRFGVPDVNNACPDQDARDTYRNCTNAAKELEKLALRWLAVHKENCAFQQQNATTLAAKDCKGANTCQQNAQSIFSQAAKYNQRELALVRQIQAKVKELKKFATDIAQGAVGVQREAEQATARNPDGKDEVSKFMKTSTNKQAKQYFDDYGQTIEAGQKIVDALKNESKSEIERPSAPLLKEPVEVALAADQLKDDFEAREADLTESQNRLSQMSGSSQTNERNLAQAGSSNTASTAIGAGSGTGSAADGLGSAAGGLGSAAGAAAPLAGLAAGGGGGGGGSSAESLNSYTVAQDPNGNQYYTSTPRQQVLGSPPVQSTLLSSGSSSAGSNGAEAASRTTSIQNLPTGGTAGISGEYAGGTGASKSPSSRARDALRARLGQLNSGSVAASADSLSGSGGATGGGFGGGSEAASTAAIAGASAPAVMSAAAVEDMAAASADLGSGEFSMAGSETDSFVQNMMQEFSATNSSDAGRHLASVDDNHEILEEDSASLFLRARATHQRSLKKGLVINGLRSKL